MPFASTALAARIEAAEASLIADSAEATARRRPDEDVAVVPLAGGVAVYAGAGSPLCKVAGMGFGEPVDEERLEQVERMYAQRGAPVRVELASLADPSIGERLTRRGYVLAGFENVLARGLDADPPPRLPAGIEVSVSPQDELDRWLDVVVAGFAHPDTQGVPSDESFPREVLERVIADMTAAEGFVRYLARRGRELAGGASLRVHEGVAQLCGAATLPAHRRRGVQSALLAARLADAARRGCDLAVVTTQPGSKSQENVQRSGFELLYARAVLIKEPRNREGRREPCS